MPNPLNPKPVEIAAAMLDLPVARSLLEALLAVSGADPKDGVRVWFVECEVCEGSGNHYENHGYGLTETLSCHDCRGTGGRWCMEGLASPDFGEASGQVLAGIDRQRERRTHFEYPEEISDGGMAHIAASVICASGYLRPLTPPKESTDG